MERSPGSRSAQDCRDQAERLPGLATKATTPAVQRDYREVASRGIASGRNQTDDSRHRASHRDCFVAPLLAMTAILGCHCERSEAISAIAGPVPTVRFVPLAFSMAEKIDRAETGGYRTPPGKLP